MICYKCKEAIETGEACIPEPADQPGKFRFFHPECHFVWVDDQRVAHQHTLETAARSVH
jgi:hypothetical protein